MADDALSYRSAADSAQDAPDVTTRSLGNWLILCLVWAVGLAVWAVYLGVGGYLVLRLLS